jgi:pimeloyl-ACP methyl ester carboxylesterase
MLLHGVRVVPGEHNWADVIELTYQPLSTMEFITPAYGGLVLSRTSAGATWFKTYRDKVYNRQRTFFFDKALPSLKPDDKVSIICHSFGGYIAARLLSEGFRFHRMILIAPAMDPKFNWGLYEKNFDQAWVYWSPDDEVIPWAMKNVLHSDPYGKMGSMGPRVYSPKVHPVRVKGMLHSGWFDYLDFFSRTWIAAIEK